jgi:hypothetical protein
LLQPTLEVDKIILHVHQNHFVLRKDDIDPFPFREKMGEIRPQLFWLSDQSKKINVEPGLIQCRFADQHAACVDKATDRRATRID